MTLPEKPTPPGLTGHGSPDTFRASRDSSFVSGNFYLPPLPVPKLYLLFTIPETTIPFLFYSFTFRYRLKLD